MILLDTDIISLLLRGMGEDHRRLGERLAAVTNEPIATTVITYEEQTRGWLSYVARARTIPQQIDAYHRLKDHVDQYRRIPIVGFDEPAAAEYQRLRQARLKVGTMDLKIAAIALAKGATLVTRNLGDFVRIPGLKAEDWTTEPGPAA